MPYHPVGYWQELSYYRMSGIGLGCHRVSAMAQQQFVLPKMSDLLELAGRPAQVIEHPSWTTARETALALITAGPCLIIVLGPAGSGKSTLLRDLATTLGEHGRTACLLDFGDSQLEVGPAEVVLVDEADRMSATRLDELSRRGASAVVLAALPSRGERFPRGPGMTVVRLASLPPDQACTFLAERLAQLGLPTRCLTEAAWAGLIAHGHGVPRLLIALLGLTLFVAAEDGAEQVTGAHVEQAVAVRSGGADVDTVGSVQVEPDPAASDEPHFLAADPSTDTGTEHDTGGRWGRRRTLVATALVALFLFAAPAALLTGNRSREADRTAPPGSGGPAVVRMEKVAPVTVKPEQVGLSAPTTAAVTPETAAMAPEGPAAPLPPASLSTAPATPNDPAPQQDVSPAAAPVTARC